MILITALCYSFFPDTRSSHITVLAMNMNIELDSELKQGRQVSKVSGGLYPLSNISRVCNGVRCYLLFIIGIKNGFECFIQGLSMKGAVVQCMKAVGLSALTGALSWIILV